MIRYLIILTLILFTFSSYPQKRINLNYESKVLAENRQINIYLPPSYSDTVSSFPVIYLLDGEYTFPLVTGNIEFYSYFGISPECIVVGIDQTYLNSTGHEQRWTDGRYNEITGLPEEQGELFFSFFRDELLCFVDSAYNTSDFKIILGHSFTANYINYFLTDESPVFNGYISISPYPAIGTIERMKKTVEILEEPVYYFLSTGSNDLKGHILKIKKLDKSWNKIENDFFSYQFMDINNANHVNLVSQSLPYALEFIFKDYCGIKRLNPELYSEKNNLVEFLQRRYRNIEIVYGLKIKIRKSDYALLSSILMKRKDWDQLIKLGELCIKDYPDKNKGYFMVAIAAEKQDNVMKSIEYYKMANSLPD